MRECAGGLAGGAGQPWTPAPAPRTCTGSVPQVRCRRCGECARIFDGRGRRAEGALRGVARRARSASGGALSGAVAAEHGGRRCPPGNPPRRWSRRGGGARAARRPCKIARVLDGRRRRAAKRTGGGPPRKPTGTTSAARRQIGDGEPWECARTPPRAAGAGPSALDTCAAPHTVPVILREVLGLRRAEGRSRKPAGTMSAAARRPAETAGGRRRRAVEGRSAPRKGAGAGG